MTANTQTKTQSDIQILQKEINGIKIAMLTTMHSDGQLRSRPMATQEVEFDGTLWFFTREDSGKVASIEMDQAVNLAYADPKGNRYVSVTGSASISHDRAKIKELYTPAIKAWFPDGVDDPQLTLIRVDVTGAQYWDYPSKALVKLAGFIKATLTGKSLNTDQSKNKMNFTN